jgi:hypothetical protein
LMDACAFYDAFGEPGAGISDWLAATAFSGARGYHPILADSLRPMRFADRAGYPGDPRYSSSRRCRAGIDTACLASFAPMEGAEHMLLRQSVPLPAGTSIEIAQDEFALLDDLARDLGPVRFAQLWQSPKPVADAYFDAAGEPFTRWIGRREIAGYGTAAIGPLPSMTSSGLTVLAIAALFAASVRWAPRPRVD